MSTISDKLVVDQYGQLRHLQIETLTRESFHKSAPGMLQASDRINSNPGLTFFKTFGHQGVD